MSAFQTALALHFQTLLATAGQFIQYSNGSSVRTIKAVRTRPRATQIDVAEGVIYGSRSWEWLIDRNSLGFDPGIGHTLTDANGATYKTMPTNTNDLVFRQSDGNGTFLRVLTEQQ